MESFNLKRVEKTSIPEEEAKEVTPANDEFFETGNLALKGLSQEYVRRRYELLAITMKMNQFPNSATPNSLSYTKEKLEAECTRLQGEIGELAQDDESVARFIERVDAGIKAKQDSYVEPL